ncbi:30S ribosomal protein S7 [Rickettsiales endosymbiont of Stachyamoeba lipophora]|uniref:30S ribosomal protein S7 n=1 Tax=Rickettsiales endosymbiont of Stachyamoeba lipophora TaxID=2486578 RepID=UPI000F650F68|nr:30S ribosomal protein S7 [Rickettsiales endosymbiont of Stachyamoeba lipophora]AZL15860.1 30S ribosomal protein S7 [Rickettsiales endosymbiont of Stachyamoeba lipophora]
MSRRRRTKKRIINTDARYNSIEVAKFINILMMSGKKAVAEKIVYSALDSVAERLKRNPLEIFKEAIENLKPQLEVKSRRVGGATYQVPIVVNPARAFALAIRWLKDAAAKRSEKTMFERLAAEFRDILEKRGAAMKKREDTHKMAEANKAFVHYSW